MQSQTNSITILGLDVGERRIGVAVANLIARLPRPLTTLTHDARVIEEILGLVAEHEAGALVIGLPRGLDGQHTAQTSFTEHFAHELEQKLTIPLYWQDEAVTSLKAKEELEKRGKPYVKGNVDALAAAYILEDFLHDNPEVHI